ncbi:MAG: hypothetical protein IIY78_03585 [Clostridia bacterium]|nr:hypothetical protein [Clostridia bacterium]
MAQAEWKVPPISTSGTAGTTEKAAVKPARYGYSRMAPKAIEDTTEEAQAVQNEDNANKPDQITVSPSRHSDQVGSLGFLFEDSERTLLILLIILLSEEGADAGLIMALMYCIL